MKSKKSQAKHATPNRAAKLVTPHRSAAYSTRPQVEHHKEIRADQFTLVDSEDNDRAHLKMVGEEVVLAMGDAKGALRLTIRASEGEGLFPEFGEAASHLLKAAGWML